MNIDVGISVCAISAGSMKPPSAKSSVRCSRRNQMSRSPVSRECPCAASAYPPTIKYSTPMELSNAANSLKSLLKLRVQGQVLLAQLFDRSQPLLRRSAEPKRTVVLERFQGGDIDYFFHHQMVAHASGALAACKVFGIVLITKSLVRAILGGIPSQTVGACASPGIICEETGRARSASACGRSLWRMVWRRIGGTRHRAVIGIHACDSM